MRRELINFRADPAMAAALRELAAREGTTLSHLVRDAVRASIYSDGEGETMKADTNPFKRIMPAAQGDLAAQRSFVTDAIQMGTIEGDFAAVMEGSQVSQASRASTSPASLAAP